ncbi:unnamed protein product [Cuscuta campestris]|uniref:Uncharacterized protein n=1 Tax=Cuscuta campestris TaxID=132261 RepID=A0A484KTJ8_9ASTE|nr:unnamed protein product [Cuscuta campestris]
MAVGETGEVERQPPDPVGGGVRAENAVQEHEGLEGDDPAPGLLQTGRNGPQDGAEIGAGREADPVAHLIDAALVDGEFVVGGGSDDGGLDFRAAEGGSGGKAGQQ